MTLEDAPELSDDQFHSFSEGTSDGLGTVDDWKSAKSEGINEAIMQEQEDAAEPEREYHTDEDDVSSSTGEEEQPGDVDTGNDGDADGGAAKAFNPAPVSNPPTAAYGTPLLPSEVLRNADEPRRIHSLEKLQPDQQANRRRRRRKGGSNKTEARAAMMEELRRHVEGTGVLEAGKVAQLKRDIRSSNNGRVEKPAQKKKKSAPKVSGRQEILENRKRDTEIRRRTLMRPLRSGRRRKEYS